MSPELISIYALAAMFMVATATDQHGHPGFRRSFPGWNAVRQATKEIIAGFPTGLFLTLVGITYLFALAQNNGTIDWLVQLAVRAVRGASRRSRGSCSSSPPC